MLGTFAGQGLAKKNQLTTVINISVQKNLPCREILNYSESTSEIQGFTYCDVAHQSGIWQPFVPGVASLERTTSQGETE